MSNDVDVEFTSAGERLYARTALRTDTTVNRFTEWYKIL